MEETIDCRSITKEKCVNESNEYGIERLMIFEAIAEVLKLIFNTGRRHNVSLKIKSTKGLKTLANSSWFYIKGVFDRFLDQVSTGCLMTKDIFKGLPCGSPLLAVLDAMQRLEAESHLCVVHPGDDGRRIQQNVHLEEGLLVIQHEVTTDTPVHESAIHLRVLENEGRMMRQGRLLYRYLLLLRTFTPTIRLEFSMKMGDVVSQSDFRISSHARVFPGLPEIVTDGAFYTHESDMVPVLDVCCPSAVSPVSVTYRDASGGPVPLQASCVGLHIPVTSSSLTNSGMITLTLLGPSCLPLTAAPGGHPILAGLDLLRNGLKLAPTSDGVEGRLPYHFLISVDPARRSLLLDSFLLPLFLVLDTGATDLVWLEAHLEQILLQCRSELVRAVQSAVDQIMRPVIDSLKTRKLVRESIRSVTKAITDVVSLSDDEAFRNTILQNLQVASTADLRGKLLSRLTELSRRKHHGVWATPPTQSCDSQYRDELSTTGLAADDIVADPGVNKVQQTLVTEAIDGPRMAAVSTASMPGGDTTADVAAIDVPAGGVSTSPFQQLIDTDRLCDIQGCTVLGTGPGVTGPVTGNVGSRLHNESFPGHDSCRSKGSGWVNTQSSGGRLMDENGRSVVSVQPSSIPNSMHSSIDHTFGNMIGTVTETFDNMRDSVISEFDNMTDRVTASSDNAGDLVISTFDNMSDPVIETFCNIDFDYVRNPVAATFDNGRNPVTATFDNGRNPVTATFDNGRYPVTATFDNGRNPVTATFDNGRNPVTATFDNGRNPVTATFDNGRNPVTATFDNGRNPVTATFDNGRNPVTATFDNGRNPVTATFDNWRNPVTATFDNGRNPVTATFDNTHDAVCAQINGSNQVAGILNECITSTENVSKRDFNMLHSEDWEPEFEIVSASIDSYVADKENILMPSTRDDTCMEINCLVPHMEIPAPCRIEGAIGRTVSGAVAGAEVGAECTSVLENHSSVDSDDWFSAVLMDVQNWID